MRGTHKRDGGLHNTPKGTHSFFQCSLFLHQLCLAMFPYGCLGGKVGGRWGRGWRQKNQCEHMCRLDSYLFLSCSELINLLLKHFTVNPSLTGAQINFIRICPVHTTGKQCTAFASPPFLAPVEVLPVVQPPAFLHT